MIGRGLLYYQQRGEGLTYNQGGHGLGGVLRNSLSKIQASVQRASDIATKAVVEVGKRKALGNLLGVNLRKKDRKAPSRRRRRGQKGAGGIVARRTRSRKRLPTDIFSY